MQACNKNQVCAQMAYKMLQDLKRLVRMETRRARLPHYNTVKVYPPTPEDLKQQHPEIYSLVYEDCVGQPDRAPCPCPLGALNLDLLKARLPKRRTHGGMMLQMPQIQDETDEILPGFRLCAPSVQNATGGLSSLKDVVQEAVTHAITPCRPLEYQSPPPGVDLSQRQLVALQPAKASPAGSIGHQLAQCMGSLEDLASNVQEQSVAPSANLSLEDMEKGIQGLKRKGAEEENKEDEEDEDLEPPSKKRSGPNSKERGAEATPKAKKRATPKEKSGKGNAADAAPKTKKRAAPKAMSGKGKAGDAAHKTKKRAAPKAKSGKGKAGDTAHKTNNKGAPLYPGQPKMAVPPVYVKDFALYTDIRMQKWRLKRHGEKRDKAFSYRKDPKTAWDNLLQFIHAR